MLVSRCFYLRTDSWYFPVYIVSLDGVKATQLIDNQPIINITLNKFFIVFIQLSLPSLQIVSSLMRIELHLIHSCELKRLSFLFCRFAITLFCLRLSSSKVDVIFSTLTTRLPLSLLLILSCSIISAISFVLEKHSL